MKIVDWLKSSKNRVLVSLGIIAASFAIAFTPIPGMSTTLIVVSGTELQEPLEALESRFEETHRNIDLELKFQGSQDMVNNYVDRRNDFTPAVLIPANGEIIEQLRDRVTARGETEVFWQEPRAIARTFLVAIAWPERGKALFPNGRFQWSRVERAMQQRNWGNLGGQSSWGSFDFVMTDPTRSNSGQLTLGLWAQSVANTSLSADTINLPPVESLFSLVKRSVYLPPRSTDILLQEFITRGPNDADVATVYESIALYRWQQANNNQGKPYQIYYLSPTMETVSTAVIPRRDVDRSMANAAEEFLDFLTETEQQEVFVRFGFRPVIGNLDLTAVAESPWSQGIPGAQVDPLVDTQPLPNPRIAAEIQRVWTRVD